MKEMLGEEYAAFYASYDLPKYQALRINQMCIRDSPTGVCGGVRRGAYPDGVEPLIYCMWAATGGKGSL